MAKTVIIGKVAVKVHPDTSDFRREAQRQLAGDEARMRFEIPTKLDMKGAMLDFRRSLAALNRENRTIDARKLKLYTDIQMPDVKRQVREINREIEFHSFADPAKIHTKLKVPKLKVDDIEVQVKVIPVVLKKDLKELKKKIQDYLDGTKVHVDPVLGTVSRRRAQFQLAFLGRTRFVKFIPLVDNVAARKVAVALAALSGGRFLAQNLEDIGDFLKNIDKNINKIALVANGIAGLAGWALSASANLFSLSANLARIGEAGLALPGILGGLAIGLTTSFLALRDINKVMPGFKAGWESLKKTISGNFWAEAEGPMRRLGRELFPQLRQHIALTAHELGDFFGFFADATRKILGGDPLKRMFVDLAKSIDIAKFGLRPMVTSIRILGEQGAGQLPRLAKFFVDLNQKFAKFLIKAERSGELKQWIDDGIEAMKDFGRVITGTARILSGLAKAARAGGGSTLDTLADSLKSIADEINGPVFQKKMAQAFKAGHDAMNIMQRESGPALRKMFIALSDSLVTILPRVGKTIGTLLRMLANLIGSPAFQKGLISFFNNIGKAIESLEPAIGPLSGALGGLLDTIGKAAVQFLPLLTTALTTLSEMFLILKPSIDGLITQLGGAFLDIVVALAPVLLDLARALVPVLDSLGTQLATVLRNNTPEIVAFAKAMGEFLVTAIETLIPPLTQVLDQLLPVLASLMQTLAQTLKDMGPDLGTLIVNLGTELLNALVAIVPYLPSLVQGMLDLLNAVVPLIPQLVPLVQSLLDFAVNVLPELIKTLPNTVTLVGQLATALTEVVNAITALVGIFGGGQGGTGPGLGGVLATILEWGSTLLSSLSVVWDGLDQIVKGILNVIEGLFTLDFPQFFAGIAQGIAGAAEVVGGAIITLIGMFGDMDFSRRMADAGKEIIHGLIQGLEDALRDVRGFFERLTRAIPGWKGPEDTDRQLLRPAGRLIMQGLLSGLLLGWDDVKAALRRITDSIPDSLRVAGYNLVVGFANGMGSAMHWVVEQATNIALTAIRIVKGALDEHSPSRVAYGMGAFFTEGLADGMRSQFGEVRSVLRTLTSEIEGTSIKAPEIGMASGNLEQKVTSALRVDADGGTGAVGDTFAPVIVAPDGTAQELVGEAMFALRDLKRGGR